MKKEFRLISIVIVLFIFLSVIPSSILAGDDAAEKILTVKDAIGFIEGNANG